MSRTNRALMTTDTNQVYFGKMPRCRVQEGAFRRMGCKLTDEKYFWKIEIIEG
jgi:hypothetical protein